jgi:multidrug efflux system outer membrane protein
MSAFTDTRSNNKWWFILPLVALASCKITQPYHQPAEMVSDSLYRSDNNKHDSSVIADVPWRQLFTDTLLQSLIAEGIKNNPNLQIALTRIRQAEANLRQSKAAFLPDVNGNVSATAQKLTTGQTGRSPIYEAYIGASWEADIWGKLRSAKRAQLASLLQSEAYRRAVQTQLVSDIATNYFSLQGYDSQLQVTLRTVENRKLDVETVKALKESDVVTGAAVVQSEANRYAAEVTIPDLRQNIRQTENAISVLLGRNPGPVVRDSLLNESIHADLHTGVPFQLLANRPDVQEAEYQFRYNFELTNVARTYFYPALTITAEGGLYNTSVTNLFNTTAVFGNIVGGLTQPIFNRGLNRQRLEVARAQQDEALITFKQTLLTAGEEVSNALYAYQAAADKIQLRSQQIGYLEKAVSYTQELLKYTSNTNFTDVLTSEQSLLAAQLNHISDKLQQLQAVVNLYRSLGGGWK